MFLELFVLVPLLALLELIERLLWLEPFVKAGFVVAGVLLLTGFLFIVVLLISDPGPPCNTTPYNPDPAPRVCEIVH